jgi:hypothetical protein
MEKLPRSVQDIADVIGRERALFLIGMLPRFLRSDARGGEQVILYVPRNLKPDHQLVRLLGWQDAAALVRAFGGELLKPGNCRHLYRGFRDQGITSMLQAGLPVALVAEWFGVSERHVKNVAGSLSENPQEVCRTAANDNARHSTRAVKAA